MNQLTYTIEFDNVSEVEANRFTSELRNALLDATQDIKVDRKRDDPHTQDFGATLVLVLGTPAIIAVAQSLGDWLKLRRSVGITIKNSKGEIVGTNLTSKDAYKLAELFMTKE